MFGQTRTIALMALGALLLATFSLSLRLTAPASAQTLPTITPIFTEVFIGTYVHPSPTPEFCNTPMPAREGDIISITPGVNIRALPSASSALLANFNQRMQMRVVSGPVCQGGFNWWNITGHGVTGWVAEGRGAITWVRFVGTDPDRVECAPPLRLAEGLRFPLNYNVRLRDTPSLQGMTLTVAPAGDEITVISAEPQCADNLNWWRVQARVVGVLYEGWMAESDPRGELMVDVPPEGDTSICDFPLNFRIGDRARVTYQDSIPKRLRNQPNLNATILYDLVQNVPLEIIGGPICADTYNWWNVRVLASDPVVGWIAEGGPAQYWLAPVIRITLTPSPFPSLTPTRQPTN